MKLRDKPLLPPPFLKGFHYICVHEKKVLVIKENAEDTGLRPKRERLDEAAIPCADRRNSAASAMYTAERVEVRQEELDKLLLGA